MISAFFLFLLRCLSPCGLARGSFGIGLAACAMLAGCAGRPPLAETGEKAYALMPAAGKDPNAQLDYLIGPLDVLKISVFQEKDLTIEEVPVDASGNIIYPLIGQIHVADHSSADISKTIADRLGARFLVNPQVSVLIKTSSAQKVTVDGEVREAGVYQLQGATTLMQAVAMAKGASANAKLDEVLIFRTIGNTRYAARFDLGDIQSGYAADPQIRANDIVVVGLSRGKALFGSILAIAPTLTTAFLAIQQSTQ